MSNYKRPDPDELLRKITEGEQSGQVGKLKLFLGYVAGVGKTYAMLEAAHQRKVEGFDVVVGYVETHGREETETMLEGLEILPRKKIEYRGVTLDDLDLDAVLERNPDLILIDELAHSNAPGMRHTKRYQDVEEILSAGINVYSTINIQHLESLNDVIHQITDVNVRETVPDWVIDEAYEIELVDLPTDELINRLRDGKVYIPEQAVRAMEKFFRKGNLTALRQLSLRRAAERVDTQMLEYMKLESINGPWPAGERILVGVSSHPMSEQLIRSGRRLADDLNAFWYVVFIETPGHMRMPAQNKLRLQRYLEMAEDLGAKIVHLNGESVADTLLAYARQNNITKIVVGKPKHSFWKEFFFRSVIDQVISSSGSIDVYVVSEKSEEPKKIDHTHSHPISFNRKNIGRYLISLFLVAVMTGVGFPLSQILEPTNLVMLYLLAVVLSAVLIGRGPSILASLIGVLAFDFFFIDPLYTFTVNDTQYLLTFIGLLAVGLIISHSAAKLRDQIVILNQKERQSQIINSLSRELSAATTLDQVMQTVIRHISIMFKRESVILLPDDEYLTVSESTQGFELDEPELAVATWVYKNGKEAGRGTKTLSAALIHYYPLITAREIVGVLGTKPEEDEGPLSSDKRNLMQGVVNLAAIAIGRSVSIEKAAQVEMLKETEKLQTAFLNSISQELHTPLKVIAQALFTLLGLVENNQVQSGFDDQKKELLESAIHQTARMNHLIENLLDMTRLEAGAVKLEKVSIKIVDLVQSVGSKMSHILENHQLIYDIEDPKIKGLVDQKLLEQVIENILDNAGMYSPAGSVINVSIGSNQNEIEVSVRDQGIGIPTADLNRIFDKFYRVQKEKNIAGSGLGLSISKRIIEAHGGYIWAMNNSDQGATIKFVLPKDQGRNG